MARRRLGRGDLGAVTIINEGSYGAPIEDIDSVTAGGRARKFKAQDGTDWAEMEYPASRTRGALFVKGRDVVANLTVAVFDNEQLATWLKWATGSDNDLNGNAAYTEPPSRGLYVQVTEDMVEYLTGCTINKLTIAQGKIGDVLEIEAEIYARSRELKPSSGLYVVGSGGNPLRIMDYWHSLDYPRGGVLNSGQWTLTVNQNLEKVPGIVGEETSESGQEPYCGMLEVNLSVTVPATMSSLNVARNTGQELNTLSLTVGGYTLGVWQPILQGEGPERTPNPYEDVIEFNGSTLIYTKNAP